MVTETTTEVSFQTRILAFELATFREPLTNRPGAGVTSWAVYETSSLSNLCYVGYMA